MVKTDNLDDEKIAFKENARRSKFHAKATPETITSL